jgi:serine/threonine protein phosphatase PrpC
MIHCSPRGKTDGRAHIQKARRKEGEMAGSSPSRIATFRWVGGEAALLDAPTVTRCGRVVVGRYGGNTSAGATKNEDGALIWRAEDGGWEFAALLDAHFSDESAALIIEALESAREGITTLLTRPPAAAFPPLQQLLLALFSSPEFRVRCHQVEGEASCLIFARRGAFLWWFAVGDCLGYLLHEELARLGQFAVNQRVFFTWIGRHNTFDLPAPCYTTGALQLRPGWNTLLMATDGLFEWGSRVYENPSELYRLFAGRGDIAQLEQAAQTALARVHAEQAKDSATLLVWRVERQGL